MSARCLGAARTSSASVIALLVVMSFAPQCRCRRPDHLEPRCLAHPDLEASSQGREGRVMNVALTLGSAGLAAASGTIFKSSLVPDSCRWCKPPGIDSGSATRSSGTTPTAQHAEQPHAHAAVPALTLGLITLGSLTTSGTDNLFDDLLPIVETLAVSQLVVQGFKLGVGRERPYAHYGEGIDSDDNLSFVSGHSALAFGLVTSAGIIAQRARLQGRAVHLGDRPAARRDDRLSPDRRGQALLHRRRGRQPHRRRGGRVDPEALQATTVRDRSERERRHDRRAVLTSSVGFPRGSFRSCPSRVAAAARTARRLRRLR